jgi:prepilin signal peptidase PulO-like enzyme (type II secretory pathway)
MAVPFGPFLAAGALAGLWFGPAMIGWYAERLG